MLDDYNSSTCVMREKNTTGGMAHVCSCMEVECNDVLNFSPGESREASEPHAEQTSLLRVSARGSSRRHG